MTYSFESTFGEWCSCACDSESEDDREEGEKLSVEHCSAGVQGVCRFEDKGSLRRDDRDQHHAPA